MRDGNGDLDNMGTSYDDEPGEYTFRAELIKTCAALAAALPLLKRAPASIAPSDKMFEMMRTDYQRALDDAREALRMH